MMILNTIIFLTSCSIEMKWPFMILVVPDCKQKSHYITSLSDSSLAHNNNNNNNGDALSAVQPQTEAAAAAFKMVNENDDQNTH